MPGFSRGTKAFAQAIAAVENGIAALDREGDDTAYELRQAALWLERGRKKHIPKRRIAGAEFVAEIDAARRALEL